VVKGLLNIVDLIWLILNYVQKFFVIPVDRKIMAELNPD